MKSWLGHVLVSVLVVCLSSAARKVAQQSFGVSAVLVVKPVYLLSLR